MGEILEYDPKAKSTWPQNHAVKKIRITGSNTAAEKNG